MPAFVSLIAPGFIDDIEKMNLAIDLTRITIPFLMFVSLASFFSAILNSHNRFAETAAAPIILGTTTSTREGEGFFRPRAQQPLLKSDDSACPKEWVGSQGK